MRHLKISVQNNQQIECFTERRATGFEVWLVAEVDGARQVLSHYLTHNNLEKSLAYTEGVPFRWVDAQSPEQLPSKKHQSCVEWEATIAQQKFVDLARGLYHIVPPLGFLSLDRPAWNLARKQLVGDWSDGKVRITFEREFKVWISSPLKVTFCERHLQFCKIAGDWEDGSSLPTTKRRKLACARRYSA